MAVADRATPLSVAAVGRIALPARALLWTLIGAWSAGFSALSIERHDAFNTGRFDMGNMVQAVWSTAHGHFLQVTSTTGEQISRLAAHTDVILVFFAPLWWLWPSPDMLLTAQAIAVAVGALPVFWLARKHLGSEAAGLGFALVYLLYPATEWLTLNEFHPVAPACPLLLFAFWYLDEDRLVPFAIFGVLAALTKEEIPLVLAAMGLCYALSHRRRAAGGAVFAAGVLASVLAIKVVVPHFNGAASSFYSRYRDVGGSPAGIVRTFFSHPIRVLGEAFDSHGLRYLGQLLVPLGFLWAFAPAAALVAVPELALNLLSRASPQSSIHFHYTAGEIAPLLAATVLGAGTLAKRIPRTRGWVAPLAVLLALVANWNLGALPFWGLVPGGSTYGRSATRLTRHDRISQQAVDLVPDGVVVSATNSLGAHLSARRRILNFPKLSDATWVAVDETRMSYLDRISPLPAATDLVALRRNPNWRIVFERDGVLVFRRG